MMERKEGDPEESRAKKLSEMSFKMKDDISTYKA